MFTSSFVRNPCYLERGRKLIVRDSFFIIFKMDRNPIHLGRGRKPNPNVVIVIIPIRL